MLTNQFENKSLETNEPKKILVCKQYEMNESPFETSLKNDVLYTISKLSKTSLEKVHKNFEFLIKKNYNELVNNSNAAINQKFIKKLQEFEATKKLKIETAIFFKKFKEFNKINTLVSSNFVPNYLILNKIITTKSAREYNSYNLTQKNRFILQTNQKFLHRKCFEEKYVESINICLSDVNYANIKKKIKLFFDYCLLTSKYMQVCIINNRLNNQQIKIFENTENFNGKRINKNFIIHSVNDAIFNNITMRNILKNKTNLNTRSKGYLEKCDFILPIYIC